MSGEQPMAGSIFDINLRTLMVTLFLAVATSILAAPAAQAQTFQVLHTFTGGDGANPVAGLIMDRAGRLYGTTSGSNIAYGSVFKMAASGSGWILSPLYNFKPGSNGFSAGEIIFGADGNLYGVTGFGGVGGCSGGDGCGTVFKLQPPAHACVSFLCYWSETVLTRFPGTPGGYLPGNLIFDTAGNLYGTTAYGGTGYCSGVGCGTVYELTPSGGGWTLTYLYNFQGGNDGYWPTAGLIFDAAGNLYGTAQHGGNSDLGVVFELSPSNGGWTETTLHSFQGSDGAYPSGTLIADQSGNLYGVALGGGSAHAGTVFELAQPGNWTFELLYSFSNTSPGNSPLGALVFDNAGNLYGTTEVGGAYGNGTAFKLAPSNGGWVETDLHDFAFSDGVYPNGSLIFDSAGNLYGTTEQGGSAFGGCYIGCGTVWELTP